MGSEYSGSNNSAKNPKERENENNAFSSMNEKIVQQVQNTRSKGFLLEHRVSPRLKNIPNDKRPYYGSEQRRRLTASKSITATENVSQHVPKIRSQGTLLERRFSPRLRDMNSESSDGWLTRSSRNAS